MNREPGYQVPISVIVINPQLKDRPPSTAYSSNSCAGRGFLYTVKHKPAIYTIIMPSVIAKFI